MKGMDGQISLIVFGALLFGGCGGRAEPSDRLETQQSAEATPVGTSLSDCPSLALDATLTTKDGAPIITKVCFVDEQNRVYAGGLGERAAAPVLPGGHTYSVVYEFADGWVPDPAKASSSAVVFLTSGGAGQGGAAPCVSSVRDGARVVASVTVSKNTLSQGLAEPLPNGQGAVSSLDLIGLYGCDIACDGFFGEGFDVRFFAASAPSAACGQ